MKEESIIESTQPKNNNHNKGLKIATVVMSILALAGVGFGIYGMLQSSDKDHQISDLKVQIKNSNGTTTTLETPEVSTTTEDGTTVTISDSATPTTVTENTQDYIYVGAWGIKIKIPQDQLNTVSYSFNGIPYTLNPQGLLCVNGTKRGGQYVPEFADISKNQMLCVSRGTGEDYEEGQPWYRDPKQAQVTLDGYYYWVPGPQALYTQNESEKQWEVDSVQIIKEMLSNPDNYSKI